MGFKRKLRWLILVLMPLFLFTGCGDLEPEMQDTRTVILNMDYHKKSSSRTSSVSAAELSQYNTHLILALPYGENLTSSYKNFYSSFAQGLMNTADKKVSLEIPLNTQMKIFAFLFQENYSMSELFSGNNSETRTVGYYGESESFSIGEQTNNFSRTICLIQVPGTPPCTTAPTVSSISSTTDNQSKISVTDTISVTFSESMDTTSVTTNTSDTTCSGSLQFSSDNFSTCVKMSSLPTTSNTNKTFTLSPSDNLSNYTSYKTIVTTAVKDSSGNTLSSQFESSSITTVNTEISVVVIYPENIQSWDLGGVDNETFIEAAIARTNAIWNSQDVGGRITLAGHTTIDFSAYSSASSAGWKADLVSALMNHTDTSIHQELQDNLTSIMDAYSADCLIYWRPYGDNSSAVNGASDIENTDKYRCLMQLEYWSMGDTTIFTHEFGHLQGCFHENGYESPSPVTFTYVNNQTYNDYYRTIMKTSNTKSVADNTSLSEVWKFSTPNQTISSSENLTVNCSRHVPSSGGGTSHNDYQCRYE